LFALTFDPTVVVVTNITQGSALFEVPITNPAAFTAGTVQFAANNPTFTPANGVLTLATIMFHVIGSPGTTSPLKLQFPPLANGGAGVLVDSNFQAIGSYVRQWCGDGKLTGKSDLLPEVALCTRRVV
jgi:hypothetical protein